MNSKWKDLSSFQKVITVLCYIFELATAVFLVLDLSGVWEYTEMMYMVFLSLVCLCDAVLAWNTSRKLSYLWIVGTVLFMGAFIVGLFI